MRPLLEKIRRPALASGSRAEPDPAAPSNSSARPVARALADALDRAVELRLWEHAERLASMAARIARHHARLTDRLARLRLAQGDAETAIALIDACEQMPSSLRLLRAACLLRLGRTVEAHLDLHRWSRRPSAPLAARLLLALLEWEGGDRAAATDALRRNLLQLEDGRTLELLVLLSACGERDDWVEQWSERLRNVAAWTSVEPDADLLLLSMDQRPTPASIEPTAAQVDGLAMELIAQEAVIPALVDAQRLEPHEATNRLISRAIEIALPDLGQRAIAMEQLARLALLRDEPAVALSWAERALEASPMSASLALLVHELRGERAPAEVVAETTSPDAAVVARIGGPRRPAPQEEPTRGKAA